MKKIIKIAFLLSATAFVFNACSKKPDIEYTSTYKMSNEWFVQTFEDGDLALDFAKIITYNTSDPASGKIWVDDQENIWPFKAKVDVDYPTLAFKPVASSENLYETGETISVIEGKVVPGGGHSKTGVVVDSIYLKVTFSEKPGKTYEFKGHSRTGFLEDEY
ncbi:MAG: lipid-binding protein [Flavisolibacter sp.]